LAIKNADDCRECEILFYTEHAPKSNRESELNSSFDENEKINFALRFLKYVAGFMQPQRQKRGYQICLYSQIYTKPTTKNL